MKVKNANVGGLMDYLKNPKIMQLLKVSCIKYSSPFISTDCLWMPLKPRDV